MHRPYRESDEPPREPLCRCTLVRDCRTQPMYANPRWTGHRAELARGWAFAIAFAVVTVALLHWCSR